MTIFVHHAIVHCGEDRCWHGDGHCDYLNLGVTPHACKLFDADLISVPGTGAPARCDECLAAQGGVLPAPKPAEEPEEPWHRCCYDAVRASHCVSWGTPDCTGPTHNNICHRFYARG